MLELNFLDKKLAEQGFKDTGQISHLVELFLSLSNKQLNLFLYAYTLTHIMETRGPKPKWKNYHLPGFMLELAEIFTQVVKIVGQIKSRTVFLISL